MKLFTFLQLITGIHRVHHIHHSYGWKMPFIGKIYYCGVGWKDVDNLYHDCAKTGKY